MFQDFEVHYLVVTKTVFFRRITDGADITFYVYADSPPKRITPTMAHMVAVLLIAPSTYNSDKSHNDNWCWYYIDNEGTRWAQELELNRLKDGAPLYRWEMQGEKYRDIPLLDVAMEAGLELPLMGESS